MRARRLRIFLAAALTTWAAGTASAATRTARVTVQSTTSSPPIAPDFVGTAFEFGNIPNWVGSGDGPPDPVLVQLIRYLSPNGPPLIRIGGISTDRSWWPISGMSAPLGVTYALSTDWAHSVKALAQAVKGRLLLGVNLEADSQAIARAEANAFVNDIGRSNISALELGNEPPLYSTVPWYNESGSTVYPWYDHVGKPFFSRGSDWGPTLYVQQYTRILAALPRLPIAGPDTSLPNWWSAYRQFVSPTSRVRMLVAHAYGLNTCVHDAGNPAYPSIAHMLAPYATEHLLGGLKPYIAVAHAAHATYRIDEMGSITCGGRTGVSDTMASALWGVAALFTAAQDGVDGVNLHAASHNPNTPFEFTETDSGWSAKVFPLYYGALMFTRAAPAGSRLQQVTVSGPSTLRAWATSGPGSDARVVLVNDSLSDAVTVTVAPAAGLSTRTAFLTRLSAPNVRSPDVTLGGRSFGSATSTGTMPAPAPQTVSAGAQGHYVVTLPPTSAVTVHFTTDAVPHRVAPGG